ncbi:MAG: hypothetical protein IPL33_02430 [Sphingobacteriales bacterium]|nr:hypothetical protein [Sphingobacteriales bacterium]MCC7223954.1 hypothetical protein [Chitinophagales bacterium]
MKNKIFIFTALVFSLMACHKDADRFSGNYPCCFQATIDYLLSQPTIHAKIKKYKFNDEYVYGLDYTADIYHPSYPVFDENCKTLFEVGGIGNDNFDKMKEAEFLEVVWEDPR